MFKCEDNLVLSVLPIGGSSSGVLKIYICVCIYFVSVYTIYVYVFVDSKFYGKSNLKCLNFLSGKRLYAPNISGRLLCFITVFYQLIEEEDLQGEVGCLIAKGNWLLIGLETV